MTIPFGFYGPEVQLPAAGDVEEGVIFGLGGDSTGTLGLPDISEVEFGVGYGENNTEFVGTSTGGSSGTFPAESQVLSGVVFGPADNLTGNVVLPSVTDVEQGVSYGESSSLSGVLVLPDVSQVQDGVGYGANSTEFVGTRIGGITLTPGTLDNHGKTLECIKGILEAGIQAEMDEYQSDNTNDPYLVNQSSGNAHYSFGSVRIEDFETTALPSAGIIIAPERDSEGAGTNESNDITYSSLIIRVTHALGSEDKERRLAFRQLVSSIFHRQKFNCGNQCMVVSTVDFGSVKVPSAWEGKNNSVSIQRVNWLVRTPVGEGANIEFCTTVGGGSGGGGTGPAEDLEFHPDSGGTTLPSTAEYIGQPFIRTGTTNPGLYEAANLTGSWNKL